MLTVRYLNFWPDFVPSESLFHAVLLKLTKGSVKIIYDLDKVVDLQIESCYTSPSTIQHVKDRIELQLGLVDLTTYSEKYKLGYVRHSKNKSLKRIWYTAENLRSPTGVYDLTISFDPTDVYLKNLYFPFWMYRLNWNLTNKLTEIAPRPEELVASRLTNNKLKITDRRACFFSSTLEPMRLRIFESVSRAFKIDCFGSAFSGRVHSKLQKSSEYLYQICPENNLYPGYITEKLSEAWYAQNIPIWAGLHSNDVFNNDAYIDLTGLTSSQIYDRLATITSEELIDKLNQPLLRLVPKLDELEESISNLI